jgi:hypothetical protein
MKTNRFYMSQRTSLTRAWNTAGGIAVAEAKWHDQILAVTAGHIEGCFPLVPFQDPH